MREWWEGAYLGGSKVRVEEVRDEVSFSCRASEENWASVCERCGKGCRIPLQCTRDASGNGDTDEGTMFPCRVLYDTLRHSAALRLSNTCDTSLNLPTLTLPPRPSDRNMPHVHRRLLQRPSPNPPLRQQRKTNVSRNSWTS